MNYEKIVRALIDPIVEEPKSVLIRVIEEENGKDVNILVAAEKEDTARLIGRHGIIANSLREVLSVAGKSENRRIFLKFESFDEEKEDQSSFFAIMEYLLLGTIIDKFGLDGTAKVYSTTNNKEIRYKKGSKVFLCQEDKEPVIEKTIESFRTTGQIDYIKFKYTDVNDIETYKKFNIVVPKDRSDLKVGYYFYSDLEGCGILDKVGKTYGKVKRVEEFPAQTTLRVGRENAKDFFVPFIKEFILNVDIDKKEITVNIIEGML